MRRLCAAEGPESRHFECRMKIKLLSKGVVVEQKGVTAVDKSGADASSQPLHGPTSPSFRTQPRFDEQICRSWSSEYVVYQSYSTEAGINEPEGGGPASDHHLSPDKTLKTKVSSH